MAFVTSLPSGGTKNSLVRIGNGPAPAPVVPVKAPPLPYPGYLTPAQQMAQAQQMATTSYQPILDEYHRQQAQQASQSQASGQQLLEIAKALAAVLGGIAPATQQAYQSAARDTSVFAQGYSHGLQLTGQQAAGQTNDFLQNVVGAPAGQNVPADRATQAADVAYGLGGAIPANTLEQQGAAFTSAALGLPAQALGVGQQQFLENTLAGNAAQQKISDSLNEALAKLPGTALGYLGKIQAGQLNAAKYAASQKRQAKLDALNAWATVNRVGQGQQRITMQKAQQQWNKLYQQGELKIRWNQLGIAEQRLALSQANGGRGTTKYQKGPNGTVFDPTTGQYLIPGTNTPINPNVTKTVKPTAAQLGKARGRLAAEVGGYFSASSNPDVPLTDTQLFQIAKSQKATYGQLQQLLTGAKQGDQQAISELAKWGITPQAPIGQHQDDLIQGLYISLAKDMGIPARQAFDMVASRFPQWGKAHRAVYFPKAGAAANGGDIKQTAFRTAQTKYGWGPDEQAALETLWTNESGWNPQAVNPSSGAAGIPQALGHTLPADYASNPVSQINWGLDYIKQRYGTPSRALAFWNAQSPHWY